MSGVDVHAAFPGLDLNPEARTVYEEMIEELLTIRPQQPPYRAPSDDLPPPLPPLPPPASPPPAPPPPPMEETVAQVDLRLTGVLPHLWSEPLYQDTRHRYVMERMSLVDNPMPTPMPPPMPMRQITDTDSAVERAERGRERAKQREAALISDTFSDAKCSAEREAMCTFLDKCEDLPDQFKCPLSLVALRDPVCCSDGHVYEREYIQRHILTAWKSPLTRKELLGNVYPVLAITQLMESWAKQRGYSAHPAAVLV
tara:strand:- start:12333 stop:13100 length:768 start_codon:yes stop_codon:yes gene_type:complete